MLARAPKPFVLPKLSHEAAERGRRLGVHRAPLVLPGAKGFALSIADDDIETVDDAELVRIEAELGGSPFSLTAPRSLIHELIQALGPAITVAELPPDIGGLLLEASIASLLTMLETATGHSILIRSFDNVSSPVHGMPLILQGPDRFWPLHLSCNGTVLDALLDPWPAGERDMDWLGIPSRLRVGLTTLELDVLRSLRPGDVVLVDTRPPDASAVMLVVAERICAMAAIQGNAAQVLQPGDREQKEWIMSGFEPSGDEAGDLNDLPVRLAFDLGQVDIPLGELKRLDAGMVLELGRKSPEFVDISANGRRIGRGELVDVDGVVGVRISKIFARNQD